jgi:PAS domain-containing protein
VLTGPLPHGWVQARHAPLEADGGPWHASCWPPTDPPLGGRADVADAAGLRARGRPAGAAHLRRLTEATSKLQAVVDQSSDGILVLDGEGVVQLWSPALEALTGTDETSATGQLLSESVRTTTPRALRATRSRPGASC